MTTVKREKYLDEKEVNQLRSITEARAILHLKKGCLTGPLNWMVIDLALQTGLRVSEMAKISVQDIDLKRCCIKVWRSKKKQPTQDTIVISKELAKHLQEYIDFKKLIGQSEERLFIGKKGLMTRRGLQQIWTNSIVRAGLPKELTIHCARHTLAVTLLSKTKNLRLVQKQLGHSSPVTTANMYADVSFSEMQDGLNGLYT